jgi:hypothetical protein
VIECSGGVVQAAYCLYENCTVHIVDFDELENFDSVEELLGYAGVPFDYAYDLIKVL